MEKVLDQYSTIKLPPVPVRFFVVDNGSDDDTIVLLNRYAATGRLPITVMQELRPGKNRALNCALPLLSDAELVVLTDDDVYPDVGWLEAYWAAAVANPGFEIFGGTIRPRWSHAPPQWLFNWDVDLGVVYSITDRQAKGPIPANQVWGPNMAVRGSLLRAGHRFAEDVGPNGTLVYAMGSETEFTTRLERLGHRACFVPDAIVEHLIRPAQMTEEWIIGRAFRSGLGHYRLHPGFSTRQFFKSVALYASLLVALKIFSFTLSPSKRFRLRWRQRRNWGLIVATARRWSASAARVKVTYR